MRTKELCRRARITKRGVQWWCEAGILKCTRNGHFRNFDEAQALVAAIISQLRRKGVSLPRVRKMIRRGVQGDFLVVMERGAGEFRWVSEADLIRSVALAPGPCLVVSVEDVRRCLHG